MRMNKKAGILLFSVLTFFLPHRLNSQVNQWENPELTFISDRHYDNPLYDVQQFEWWDFRPAHEWLIEQPGKEAYNHFISLSKKLDHSVILAYVPAAGEVKIRNPLGWEYAGKWFDPATNESKTAEIELEDGIIKAISEGQKDIVLVLRKK